MKVLRRSFAYPTTTGKEHGTLPFKHHDSGPRAMEVADEVSRPRERYAMTLIILTWP
jgi:hypothetical protein